MIRHPAAMRRRLIAVLSAAFVLRGAVAAGSLDSLSNADASSGLRTALGQGIDLAVSQLGTPNGFLNDPKVRIPLPPALAKADKALRLMGKGDQADALKAGMNHAAEQAVADAKPIFKTALSNMSVEDAKGILSGGDDAGTQYFRRTTSADLTRRFKPVVAETTRKLELASLYDRYAGQAASLGLVKQKDANLDDYVTAKALDGLFSRIAEQEKAIRMDPMGQGSAILKKVFGALQ